MISKTLLLSTMALSGVCYAGLLCSTSNANSFIPWIKENFEKIKPLLEESVATTSDIYEEEEDVIHVASSSVLKPREDSKSLEITPIQVKVLPEKEELIKPESFSEPTTIPLVPKNVKNQSLTKPRAISKPEPNMLVSRSPKLMLKKPSNVPKQPRRLRFRWKMS